MNDKALLRRLLAYDDWANREALASIRASGSRSERLRQLMAHLVGVQQVWLSRMRRDGSQVATWPDYSLDRDAALLDDMKRMWSELLATLPDQALAGEVRYTNTKGKEFSNTLFDIITHVMMHGAYHRGQIAQLVRQGGGEPAVTDYIHAVREGKLSD